MKKFFLTIGLIIFSLHLFAQDSGFVIGAYITPSYSFRSIKAVSSAANDTLKKANSVDRASGKVDFGIRLSANLSHHWKATVGLAYATKGYTSNMTVDTYSLSGVKNTIGVTQYNRYTFIEVPVYLTYKMGDSNFTFGILAGISNSFLTQYQVDVPTYDLPSHTLSRNPVTLSGSDLSSNNFTTYYLNILVGVEFSYRISESFNIFAQPNFRYSLNNMFPGPGGTGLPAGNGTSDLLDGRLWNLGLSLGADYRF